MQRIILHLDFDSFFASVEQQNHPEFQGKPLGVTAANSRTCIIAASREAKRFGIQTGSTTYDGYKKCPFLLVTPAHFEKYFEISKKFILICRKYSPFLEVFSIDELFLDVTQTVWLFGSVENLIRKIKEEIKSELGSFITVSVGVSHNKLLAKLASGLKKPDGLCFITPDMVDKLYESLPLTEICGIGNRIARRLQMLGVYTPLAIRKVTFAQLRAEFGEVEAHFLVNVAYARDETPVVHFGEAKEVKSVGRNYCLPKNEYRKRVVLQNLFELSEEIGIKLRRLHKKARTVGYSLRGDTDIRERLTQSFYTQSGKEIFDLCKSVLPASFFQESSYTRQISVWVASLKDENSVPLSLFEKPEKSEKLIRAIDELNDRFGDHTIRNGFLLYADKLTTMPNGYLADRFERQQLSLLY